MDPMQPSELQEVRKIIESSTSKVSLRDLEKKGFRKVKVLRSNDIDELIRRAVTAVVAREGAESKVTEELIEQSRQELKRLMAQTQKESQERADVEARAEALEAENAQLKARAQEAQRLEAAAKELQRRLADEQEARRAAEARAGGASQTAASQTAQLQDLRRRAEDAESRAAAAQALLAQAEAGRERLTKARDEAEELRMQVKSLETEKRLTQELEIPKFKERIAELEGDLRAAKQAGAGAAGTSEDRMRAMFREMLTEVGAGQGGGGGGAGADVLKSEFAKLQSSIAESLARAGGRGEKVTDADLAAAKVSLEALFRHDAEGTSQVQSNIQDVKFKEQTTTSDLKGKMDRLKSLRKGGKSE